jgi:WhiB family redox-sensing transcriptional regulator
MTWNDNWPQLAQCKDDPEEMFVKGAEQHQAKKRCLGCPVRTECLAEALDNELEWGVWGGMTERERRAVLKARPNVTSWRRLLETARAEQAPVAGSVPEVPLRRLVPASA